VPVRRHKDVGELIRACDKKRSTASLEISLMSAPRSGKFSKTDFKKTGFSAAGPEPTASGPRGTEHFGVPAPPFASTVIWQLIAIFRHNA
jgi:hypothetical protein